jgi:hypothetical protein
MDMGAILRVAGVKPAALASFGNVSRRSIYNAIKQDPCPLWLLQALAKWSETHVFESEDIRALFNKELAAKWPSNPFTPIPPVPPVPPKGPEDEHEDKTPEGESMQRREARGTAKSTANAMAARAAADARFTAPRLSPANVAVLGTTVNLGAAIAPQTKEEERANDRQDEGAPRAKSEAAKFPALDFGAKLQDGERADAGTVELHSQPNRETKRQSGQTDNAGTVADGGSTESANGRTGAPAACGDCETSAETTRTSPPPLSGRVQKLSDRVPAVAPNQRNFTPLDIAYEPEQLRTVESCVGIVETILSKSENRGHGYIVEFRKLAERIQKTFGTWGYNKSLPHITNVLRTRAELRREDGRRLSIREAQRSLARETLLERIGGEYETYIRECRKSHGGKKDAGHFGKDYDVIGFATDWLSHNSEDVARWFTGLTVPSPATVAAWLRAEFGSKREHKANFGKKAYFRTDGFTGGGIAGAVMEIDATALSSVFDSPEWGACDKNAKTLRWIYLSTCAESGRVQIHGAFGGKCEDDHWLAAVKAALFHDWGFAPSIVVSDQDAALFAKLNYLKPGRLKDQLPDAARLLLACDISAVVPRGNNPTAKAHVERGVRIFRHEARAVLRPAWFERLGDIRAGKIAEKNATHFAYFRGEAQFTNEFIPQVQTRLDAKVLERAGKPRLELWNDPASAAWREQRALAEDAAELFPQIDERMHVMEIHGETIRGRWQGHEQVCKLQAHEGFKASDEARLVIVVPCGMLKAHNRENAICYVVNRGKTNQFTVERAGYCRVALNQFGQSDGRPTLLKGYSRLPLTDEALRARKGDEAAAATRKELESGLVAAAQRELLEEHKRPVTVPPMTAAMDERSAILPAEEKIA